MADRRIYDDGFIVTYDEGDISAERIPIEIIQDLTDKLHPIVEDETLLTIAHQYYPGKSFLWYAIADVNKIDDIFNLEVGQEIIIPNILKIT